MTNSSKESCATVTPSDNAAVNYAQVIGSPSQIYNLRDKNRISQSGNTAHCRITEPLVGHLEGDPFRGAGNLAVAQRILSGKCI